MSNYNYFHGEPDFKEPPPETCTQCNYVYEDGDGDIIGGVCGQCRKHNEEGPQE